MRVKKIAASLAALTVLGALAVPAAASAAKPHRYHQPASVVTAIFGSASSGFRFTLLGDGSRGGALLLWNPGPHGTEDSVSYSTSSHGERPVFKGDSLDLRIGRLGRFRARFVPRSTRTEEPQGGCTGGPTLTEKGYFVGSFSFHGERGYTTIHSQRERGIVGRQGATSCPASTGAGKGRRHPPAPKGQREREADEFRLVAGDANGHVFLQGRREESPEPEEGWPTTFQATVTETVGGLHVSHSASADGFGPGAEESFLTPNLAEPIAEATLTPPAPFSGSAAFHLEGPKTASWTGDLAVKLPGLGKVPLTGNDIDAGLCKGRSHCTKTLPEPLQLVLEAARPGARYFFGGTVTTTVGLPG